MATSPFFDQHINRKSEQDLLESLVIENIQLSGQDVIYAPMEKYKLEPILREAKDIIFDSNYIIEAYMPLNGDTEGEDNILSKFGFRSKKKVEVLMSKKRFQEVTGKQRPLEGDLIYIGALDGSNNSYMNEIFEINNVSYKGPEWMLGGHFVYRLFCELYVYSYDKMTTGVPGIDQMDMTGDDVDVMARLQSLSEASSNNDIKKKMDTMKVFDKKNPLSGL